MKRLVLLSTLLLTLLSGLAESPLAQANVTSNSHQVTASHLMTTTMPLMFIEQQPNHYQVQLNGQSMWFTEDSMWLTTQQQNIKLTFQDTNLQARIEPINKLETHISTFRGNDPAKWQTDMPVYGGVRYRNLYPNTDLIITSEQGKLAWQWETVVGAGLVPAHVADSQTGQAQGLPLPGNIRVSVDNGHTPTTHTLDPNQSLTDQLAAIIDPQTQNANFNSLTPRQQGAADLVWSSFLGWSQGEQGTGIVVDSVGYIYAVGYTWSPDFPSTVNTYKPSDNGGVYVAKINPSGNGLVYLTFFGGRSADVGVDIAIDSSGNAYVTGETWSADFPTTSGAFSTVHGYYAAFVTKLNSTGTTLLYSTFLGSGGTRGNGIAVDSNGSAYITGRTQTSSFPVTTNAFDKTLGGANDAFVAKLNPSGTALDYATFLGGNNTTHNEDGNSIVVDNVGNAYITGMTNSTDFPFTTGTFDTTLGGGTCGIAPNTYTCVDAFVTKINPTGTDLSYSAFLGGSKDERGQGIALDTAGNAYITGFTNSSDFPTTTGAFDKTFSGGIDGFVAKVNPAATSLTYSTFLGGSSNECWDDFAYRACDIAVDAIGNAYIVGWTESTDFPTTANSFDSNHNGLVDVFVAKFDTTGASLIYSTYIGGTDKDGLYFNSIAVDGVGNIYITSRTHSTNFPTTSGVYDTTYGGGESDSYIAKLAVTPPTLQISPTTLTFNAVAGGTNPLTQALTISNTGGGTLSWTASDNATWLNLGSTSGTAPSTVNVNADITGLAAGTYNGNVFINSNGGNFTTTVTLNLSQPPTPTDTPTITPTVIVTPQPSVTPNPDGSDPYEADNSCPEAKAITTDGLVQSHTFHAVGDEDWVKFEGITGTTYLIDARVPDDSIADVVLVMYDKCNGTATPNDAFNPDIHVQFKAPSTGTYYLHLTDGNDNGGANVSYQLSVRQLGDVPSPGMLVLVGGKLRANDSLQRNIYNVTNNVYRLFTNQGYPPERITYLANDVKLDPDNDVTTQDVDNLASRATLEQAILQAADKVGPDRAFTLYMMDHGNEDKFYLNGGAQTVDPDELSQWLDKLEAAAPGVKVNVIIDACYSGSFIKGTKRLGKAGRVIIASTTDQTSAYASKAQGAIFSDSFIQGLGQKWSLYDSFMEGQTVAKTWYPQQKAWLDANGNGIPNEAEDFSVAQQRGFALAGTFDPPMPPYIATANGPTEIKNGQGELQALVKDDVGATALDVWAVIYKPSYITPTTSEELVADVENLPTIKLNGPDSNQVYRGLYEGFNETGTYRLVIYAKDEDGLLSRPRELTVIMGGKKSYLPIIVK